jgi:hypothetical protein
LRTSIGLFRFHLAPLPINFATDRNALALRCERSPAVPCLHPAPRASKAMNRALENTRVQILERALEPPAPNRENSAADGRVVVARMPAGTANLTRLDAGARRFVHSIEAEFAGLRTPCRSRGTVRQTLPAEQRGMGVTGKGPRHVWMPPLLAANGSAMAHLRFILNPIAGNPGPLTNVAHTMSSTAYVKSLKCIALRECS